MVERSFGGGERNTSFMVLMARCHSEPNAEVEQLIRAHFQKMMSRLTASFLRALPELPREELFWRLKFTFGSLHHALLTSSKQDSLPGTLRKKLDSEGLVRRLVAFAAAGMRAPVPV